MRYNREFRTISESFRDAVWIGESEQGSPEWHAMRSNGIGGSEIGTIMGLNPWESAFSLWAKRTGQIASPPVDNWAVRFGHAFEEPILQMWAEDNPDWEVFRTGTWSHPSYPFLHANPDALAQHRETGEWMVIEVKTARSFWDDVPPAYRAQVLHYMDVMGVRRGVVVAIAGWNWEVHDIVWEQFEADAQRSHAQRFWEHLQKHVRPEWDGSKATYEAQRQLNPAIADEEVVIGQLGHDLVAAQRVLDEAESRLLEVKSRVLDKMGTARHATMLVDGDPVRVASRQARGNGAPWLVIKKGKN
jgi:putative phage-type endonuclease